MTTSTAEQAGPVVKEDDIASPVARATAAARKAQAWWQTVSTKERGRVLRRYRDLLIDHLDDLVAIVAEETDKPRFDIVNEVAQSCDLIGFLTKRAPRWLADQRIRPHLLMHKRATIRRLPFGVIGVITPWNYPVVLVLDPIVQALLAGNAVVHKPSEWGTRTAKFLHGLFTRMDLPEPLWQIAIGGPETAIELVNSGVDKVAFTGGIAGGKAILSAAAGRLIPVLLELGGNDAMLVAADADLERAASGAVWGAFLNAGQSCIAVERCYVERPVFDNFVAKVVERTARLATSSPTANREEQAVDHDVGRLVTPVQFDKVTALVEDAVSKGATVVAGGQQGDREHCLFPPTVLTNVDQSMRLMREEAFGPILPILPVDSLDEAVELANDSPLGLGASIWSHDVSRARRLAERVRAGGVVINDCLIHFGISELPFGGVRQSGFGRTHGREGLLEYCQTQTVTEHRLGPRYEFHWFPYGTKHRWMSRLVRLLFRSGWLARLRRPRRAKHQED